jgi:hypothetical protein
MYVYMYVCNVCVCEIRKVVVTFRKDFKCLVLLGPHVQSCKLITRQEGVIYVGPLSVSAVLR